MKVALYETATGRFTQICYGDILGAWAQVCAADQGAIEVGDAVLDNTTHYLFLGTGRIRAYPPRPSETAVFDYAAGRWKEPNEQLRKGRTSVAS